jgi:hypothetical protein
MFQPCTVTSCKRLSSAVCHCCLQNICIIHLNEHHDALNLKLNPLVDEINALEEQLQTMNMQKKVDYCRQKLEQWRVDCHQKIDHLFEQKCQELNELAAVKITKQKNAISQIRTKLAQLIKDQATTPRDLDLLISNIRYLEGRMNDIEQTSFQITIRPLILEDRSIIFKEKKDNNSIQLSAIRFIKYSNIHLEVGFHWRVMNIICYFIDLQIYVLLTKN